MNPNSRFAWESDYPRDTARAMSEENLERLKATYEAFNREDFDAAAGIAHPEIEFIRNAGLAPVRGAHAFRVWMEPETLEERAAEPLDFRIHEDKILVHALDKGRGVGSGIYLEAEGWTVWTFDDEGRVTRVEAFNDEEPALKALGLLE